MIARFRPTYNYTQLVSSLFGNKVEELLTNLQESYSTKNILLFSSARSAIYALLSAYSQGEVISPAYNCIVVPDAVRFAGSRNKFVDISLSDYNMTPASVLKAISSRTKVLMATHQFGIPCDIAEMVKLAKNRQLFLFEDAAAAMGAQVNTKEAGNFGDAAVISFQYTKVISAVEGGALIIRNQRLFNKVASKVVNKEVGKSISLYLKGVGLKNITHPLLYGAFFALWSKLGGVNTKAETSAKEMSEDYMGGINQVAANLVSLQLRGLKMNVEKRRSVAGYYLRNLAKVDGLELPKVSVGTKPSWTRFPIRVKNKKRFFKKMTDSGVDLAWTFSYSCPIEYGERAGFPNSNFAAKHVLDLPIYPGLSLVELKRIEKAIKNEN